MVAVSNIFIFHFIWECHHPNWRTHIFQRGRYSTNQILIQSHELLAPSLQWEFQDPTDGGTYHIFGLFFRPKFQGISPQNMAKHMVLTYLHLLDPGDLPLIPPLFHTRPEVEQLRSDGNKQGEATTLSGGESKLGITNPLNGYIGY